MLTDAVTHSPGTSALTCFVLWNTSWTSGTADMMAHKPLRWYSCFTGTVCSWNLQECVTCHLSDQAADGAAQARAPTAMQQYGRDAGVRQMNPHFHAL